MDNEVTQWFSLLFLCFSPIIGDQVKVSLDSLIDSLNSLSDTGDCVARVEKMLKELKTLEEKAQVCNGTVTHTIAHNHLIISNHYK